MAGIPLTSEKYSLVIKLLQDRFSRKEAIVESLYSKLQNLPKTGNKFAEVQHMCETIEKLLQQLEAQGEYISEQRILIQQIISKYPMEIITKLEESKEPGTPWTMKSLRKSIHHYITVQENVQHHVSNDNLKVKGQPFVSKQTRPFTASYRSSTEVLAVNSQAGSSVGGQARASLPFIFCKGNHFNDMYNKCVTLTEKKQKLSQQKRCFVCLKIGHMSRNCPSSQKKSCCYCGKKGYHNRCLCSQKFARQGTDALMVTEVDESSEDSIGGVSSVYQSNQLTATVNSNAGERVLLQIATVPVQSVNGSLTVTARILLDSASQRTFMTDQLAKRLKLTPEYRELLSVSTLGAGKATDVDTYVVHCRVKLKDGLHMLMFANVLK